MSETLLSFLLRERPPVVVADDLVAWWRGTSDVRERFVLPIERALTSGFLADRLGFAFAAGYEAALHALIPALASEAVASFCVTEEDGNHPRAIRTRLEPDADDFVLTGSKRWSTMGPLADVLVVIARAGTDLDGRPRLKAVCVDKNAPNLTVKTMPPTPFVPEVPHAELTFDGVRVASSAVLSGDGYVDHTKAFRTVEDLHVNAAMVGYLLSVATRCGFPESFRERFVALGVAACSTASLDPRTSETHVVLAGLLSQIQAVVAEADASFTLLGDAERDRWYRDRVLTQVASKAREQRRERAWQALNGEGRP